MRRGKRMLAAQERQEGLADDNGSGSGRLSTSTSSATRHGQAAYLRSDRAFGADGTPNRPSRSATADPLESGATPLPEVRLAEKRRKRSRSQTPPRQTTALRGGTAAGLSPAHYAPPAVRSLGNSPLPPSRPSAQQSPTPTVSSRTGLASPTPQEKQGQAPVDELDGIGRNRSTPRRRSTRRYPIARVTAAVSGDGTPLAADDEPELGPPPVRLTAPGPAWPAERRTPTATDSHGAVPFPAAPPLPRVGTSPAEQGASSYRPVATGEEGPMPLRHGNSPESSPLLLPPLGRLPSTSAVGRLPVTTPPLRAAVSPRTLPQHYSRTASASQQSTPTVGASGAPYSPSSQLTRATPPASQSSPPDVLPWTLPTAAVSGAGHSGWDDRHSPHEGSGRHGATKSPATPPPQYPDQSSDRAVAEARYPPRGTAAFPSTPPLHPRVEPTGAPRATHAAAGVVARTSPSAESGTSPAQIVISTDPSTQRDDDRRADGAVDPDAGLAVGLSPRGTGDSAAVYTVSSSAQSSPVAYSPSTSYSEEPLPLSTAQIHDFSGFHNRGNDCYACSVLTLLLRSLAFRRALLTSPLVCALRAFQELQQPVRVGSGYTAAVESADVSGAARQDDERAEQIGASGNPAETRRGDRDDPSVSSQTTLTAHDDLERALCDVAGDLRPTVHDELAALTRELWLRERVVFRVVYDRAQPERHRLGIYKRFLSRYTDQHTGDNLYDRGIGLRSLASLFEDDFFTGQQEDAHELFVSLIAKLEVEAEQFAKRAAAISEAKKGVPDASPSADTTGGKSASAPPASVWVNELMQGKLLNIIRCGNPSCGHHIATDETYINLSPAIVPRCAAEGQPPAPRGAEREDGEGADAKRYRAEGSGSDDAGALQPRPVPVPSTTTAETATTAKATAAATAAAGVPSVSSLLHHSLQYGALDDYVCDACHSKERQFQGACFFRCPPPVLVVQLKRFTPRSFIAADGVFEVVVDKDQSPVRVEESLEVYSLCSEAACGHGAPATAPAAPAEPYYHAETKTLSEAILAAERAAMALSPDERESGAADALESVQVCAIRTVYQLRGTVLHLGSQLTYGHYVAQFAVPRPPPGAGSPERERAGPADSRAGADTDSGAAALPALRWRRANDEHVVATSLDRTRDEWQHSSTSYLLLYEKVHEERVRCPVWRVLPLPGSGFSSREN